LSPCLVRSYQERCATAPRIDDNEPNTEMRSGRPERSGHRGAGVRKQLTQHRAMTARRVLAVAADREVRVLAERGEELDEVSGRGSGHLLAIGPLERPPLLVRLGMERTRHEALARTELREPRVIEVAGGELDLRDAPRRTTDRPEPQALIIGARRAEPHHSQTHHAIVSPAPADVPSIGA